MEGEGERDIEQVVLYVNKTQFVDLQSNIGRTELNPEDIEDLSAISISTPVPDMLVEQDYLFVRIGIKIENVEDLLFSPVQRVDL